MTFEEAAQQYASWRAWRDAGQVTQEQFLQTVGQLRVTDAAGAWWQIDAESGQWLKWNGAAWEPAAAAQPGAPSAAVPGQTYAPAAAAKKPWAQRIWDVITIAGSAAMSGVWYWYSGMADTRPDYRTCIAMILVPVLLIALRRRIDNWLRPLQPIRAKIPRMVLVGLGVAVPLLVSNFLYAAGNSQFPYIFKTYLISTLLSYVVLRQPAAPAPMQRSGGY